MGYLKRGRQRQQTWEQWSANTRTILAQSNLSWDERTMRDCWEKGMSPIDALDRMAAIRRLGFKRTHATEKGE